MKKTVLIAISLILLTGSCFAQELSNAYTPYGFQLPLLKSGEFILNARGYYSLYDTEYEYPDNPDRQYSGEGKNYYMYTRGIIALTNNILINTGLYFYPKNETSRYTDITETYESETWYEREAYIYPFFTLVYRPKKNIEIFGYYSHQSYEQGYNRKYNGEETNPNNYKYNYNYMNFGVNYFGKLWNKN